MKGALNANFVCVLPAEPGKPRGYDMAGRIRQSWDDDIKLRSIYLLAFSGKRVYVGSSVDYRRRIKQHRRIGWDEPFIPVVVQCISGIEAEAVDHEYAWRWCAHIHGWFPIYQNKIPFDTAVFWPRTRTHGEKLSWPFII
jgi:hypothetical protein